MYPLSEVPPESVSLTAYEHRTVHCTGAVFPQLLRAQSWISVFSLRRRKLEAGRNESGATACLWHEGL